MSSSTEAPGLIGIQRAAFDRAERLQRRVSLLQWALAIDAIAAALQRTAIVVYVLAVIALALTTAIIVLEQRVARTRSLGERVRRMTLIAEGLGEKPTSDELLDVGLAAGDMEQEARDRDDPNYFATKTGFGMPRLGEMLEESAFWTCHLLRGSEMRAWWRTLILTVIAVAVVLTALPLVQAEQNLMLGRLICAITLFIISKDVLGAALAYGRAARSVREVMLRLQHCGAQSWPQDRLMRIVGDYNAAVESAPLPRPGLYQRDKDRINRLWAVHKALPATAQ